MLQAEFLHTGQTKLPAMQARGIKKVLSVCLHHRATNMRSALIIGHLHDEVILLLRPESFRGLLSCANLGFCH